MKTNLPVRVVESPARITYREPRHTLKPYDKAMVLRAICMYSKWRYVNMMPIPVTHLFRARIRHGTQFIIDMFIATETYMNHWPNYAMHKARVDIIHVLNQCPNYRLLYEDN